MVWFRRCAEVKFYGRERKVKARRR